MFGLNTREEAVAIWAVAGLLVALKSPSVRRSFAGVAHAFFVHPFVTIFSASVLYVGALGVMLAQTDGWYREAPKDIVVWYLVQGLVLFFGYEKASEDGYLRRRVVETVKITAVVEFIVNLYTFPLGVELVLVPLLFLIGATRAVCDLKAEYAPAKRCIDWIIAALGVSLLSWAVASAITDWTAFMSARTVEQFLLPAVMTVAFLPFVYALGVYTGYEQIFTRLGYTDVDRRERWSRARRRVIRTCGVDLRKIARFASYANPRLAFIGTDHELAELIASFGLSEQHRGRH